ncbi:MAG: hypothetical protein AVDCRST_MAG56-7957 [uncultured Cytophagales bacterium]|uniref:Uncharacterized protein n=1 Tax=uncultured Cytophagales bacterium TaxID=158755 RepID=A0A6J4LVP1_9SPHI|nr:MAG: hypothetical protein AVDCRST_MAG56-7957 [uncultured Cytophagales bacterium]
MPGGVIPAGICIWGWRENADAGRRYSAYDSGGLRFSGVSCYI